MDQVSPLRRYYDEHRRDLDAAYRRVVDRGQFVLGEELQRFEQEFADYCGTEHCVGVGSGLDALTLTLIALGIGPGDEVIVPGNTFIATFLAVTAVGAVAVAVDPRPDTFTIHPERVQEAVTPRTRAIIPVHLFGQPADMAPILEFATLRGLMVVEDAAQAHGARYRERRVGGLADGAGFSFYPVKNLGAFGDAGAVTTNDGALAESVRLLRNYGSATKYHHDVIGGNTRLDELQAAFLMVGLAHLDRANEARARIATRYSDALAECAPVVRLPAVDPGAHPVWHQYVILCDDRDGLQRALAARSIGTLVHYPIPPHHQPAYLRAVPAALRAGLLPVTETLARTSLSLPIHPYLSDSDQAEVVDTVREFCRSGATSMGKDPEARRERTREEPSDTRRERIDEYEVAYMADYGFESVLVEGRRAPIVALVERLRPRVVVEVGCGTDLLARHVARSGLPVHRWVVVEPSATFAALARAAAVELPGVRVVEDFFEDAVTEVLEQAGGPADVILLSGLLNEVADPQVLLRAARYVLAASGLIHVSVPNAYSLHRRLAAESRLIDDVHELTERNRALAQVRVFDPASLRATVTEAGFAPDEEGGIFLKPFTNAQMAQVITLLPREVLQGLERLGRELPHLASEIYVNARMVP